MSRSRIATTAALHAAAFHRMSAAVAASLSAAPALAASSPLAPDAPFYTSLTFWLFGGATLIWLATMVIGVHAARTAPATTIAGRRLILVCGVAIPTLVIVLLLAFALRPSHGGAKAEPDLVIDVTGHMWWWRVHYEDGSHSPPETANELRLPQGRQVALRLHSTDVIHSLWIPQLAAKLDMIPGTTNTLYLEPRELGSYTGACAEYCGTAHAQMRFDVTVMPAAEFDDWLAQLEAPATEPESLLAAHGKQVFRVNGCGACHRVQGTAADGRVGPVLTHVASRLTLGAGVLETSPDAFRRWIAETGQVKPGVHMPSYGMLGDTDLAALGAYLAGLE